MTTNNKTREAIQKLIEKYKDESMSPTYGMGQYCSLCSLFLIKKKSLVSSGQHECSNCPNIAFNGIGYSYDYPCVQRMREFPTLNWDLLNHKLVEFWSAVYEVIPANDDEFIVNEFVQSKILMIAMEINK